MANNPVALDFNDLIYYDKKIKKYVDDKADLISASIPDTYTKDEIDTKIENAYKADLKQLDTRIDTIAEQVASNTANIISHREELDDIEGRILTLESDDKLITKELSELKVAIENKANKDDIPSLDDYATEEYVRAKIAEAELAGGDIDLSDYYTKLETDKAIQTAISKIPEVDLSNYATKQEVIDAREQSARNELKIMAIDSELVDISNTLETIPTKTSQLENDNGFITSIPEEYVTESELDSKGYLTEHQSLENYATKQDIEGLASVEYITNNYISTTQAENFATHAELESAVTDIVDEHFEETVIVHVDEEIEKKLAENQTINYGTFGEV